MTDDKKTILLVDDDVDFLAQQQVMLEAAGYRVVTAGGAREAEKFLADQKPDLAVVDLMMEHVDGGFSLCYQIKKLDPAIGVILVTAVVSETGIEFDAATPEERTWVKADAMLAKPFRREQLLREIEMLLARKG